MTNIEKLREAVVAIGYYIPNDKPELHGTGFLIGEGNRALTCAHVVIPLKNMRNRVPQSFPKTKEVNGKKAEFSCWAFKTKGNIQKMMRFPINNITVMMDVHIESFYLGGFPDIAYLELDVSQWKDNFNEEEITVLEVSNKVLRKIGTEVVMIGYPSTDILMIDEKTGKPRCWQPLAQFARLGGHLPFSKNDILEFLVFDTVVAKGSSGSPIIEMRSGKVIAVASRLLPFFLPTNIGRNFVIETPAPAAVGFGVPSNFFYELSLSKTGEGKFNFNYY